MTNPWRSKHFAIRCRIIFSFSRFVFSSLKFIIRRRGKWPRIDVELTAITAWRYVLPWRRITRQPCRSSCFFFDVLVHINKICAPSRGLHAGCLASYRAASFVRIWLLVIRDKFMGVRSYPFCSTGQFALFFLTLYTSKDNKKYRKTMSQPKVWVCSSNSEKFSNRYCLSRLCCRLRCAMLCDGMRVVIFFLEKFFTTRLRSSVVFFWKVAPWKRG